MTAKSDAGFQPVFTPWIDYFIRDSKQRKALILFETSREITAKDPAKKSRRYGLGPAYAALTGADS